MVGGETSYFVAKCVNISKTVGDTPKVNKLQFMTNKKLHYALSIDTKIDDLGWPWTL